MLEQTLQQLHDERRNVWAQMNELYAGGDGISDDAKKSEYRRLDGIYHDLSGKIQERQQVIDIQREHAARAANMDRDMREKQVVALQSPETAQATYEGAFWRYMGRNPETRLNDDDMKVLQTRGTSTQIGSTDSLRGYTIPQSFSYKLETMMKYYSVITAFGSLDTPIGGTPRTRPPCTSGIPIAMNSSL